MRKCHKVVLYYVSVGSRNSISINLGAVLCMYKLGLFIEDQKLQCYKKMQVLCTLIKTQINCFGQ